MTIDEAKEREAFEASGLMMPHTLRRHPDGDYRELAVQYHWRAWLARAAQPVSVRREALYKVMGISGDPRYYRFDTQDIEDILRELNIEVDE